MPPAWHRLFLVDPGDFPLFPPSLLARFRPRRRLGQGASAAVFLATRVEGATSVAVKVLAPEGSDPRAGERFQREAALLESLEHPNLVRLLEAGVSDDRAYQVLEYLPGRSLAEGEPPEEPVERMLEVADALDALHRSGLVHRDVKPENIVRRADGRLVLVDLGLAFEPRRSRLTSTGQVVGTVAYLPPEVLQGGTSSPAADWYAWGASLFALLEGRPPFSVPLLVEVVDGRRLPSPFFRRVPEGPLQDLLFQCLVEDPAGRPRDGAEVRELLAGAPPARATEGRASGSHPLVPTSRRSASLLRLLGAGVGGALAGALLHLLVSWLRGGS